MNMAQPGQPRAKFPPVINFVEPMGELSEEDNLRYPRNIGCSSILGEIPLFLFGDTFEPSGSQFLGIASSTASLGSHADPLSTRYPSSPSSNQNGESNATQFIQFTDEENEHNNSADLASGTDRYYLWTFNAVVEIPGKPGSGVVWFVKGKTCGEDSKYYGIGVAEVEVVDEIPIASRCGNVIFNDLSPQWGNVTTLLEGDFIYLYGTCYHQNHGRMAYAARFSQDPVFVCRVPHADKSYLFQERYTYWDGGKFSARPSHLVPVMFNISTGTILNTTLFSKTKKGIFVFIGCNGSGDGRVRFKCAENPWGPWRGEGWLLDTKLQDRGYGGAKSCVYAHPWASDLERGELVLSWSESWPGGVEMIRVGFEMIESEGGGVKEQEMDRDRGQGINRVDGRLIHTIRGHHKEQNAEHNDIKLTPEGEKREVSRRRTLAQLVGDTGTKDYQDYLKEHRAYLAGSARNVRGKNLLDGEPAEPAQLGQQVNTGQYNSSEGSNCKTENEIEDNWAIEAERRVANLLRSAEPNIESPLEEASQSGEGEWSNLKIKSNDYQQRESSRGKTLDQGEDKLTSDRQRGSNYKDRYRGYEQRWSRAGERGGVAQPRGGEWHNPGDSYYDDEDTGRTRAATPNNQINAASHPHEFTASASRAHSSSYLDRNLGDSVQERARENENKERGLKRHDYSDSIPLSIDERRKRLKWGNGLKIDVSTISKSNTNALPEFIHVPTIAGLSTPMAPPENTIRVPIKAHGALAQSPVGSAEELPVTIEGVETLSQQPSNGGPTEKRSKKLMEVVKEGMQKLLKKNYNKQIDTGADKPGGWVRDGLKKKFSEMNLIRATKSYVKLRKIGRSEVNLGKYAKEKMEQEALRKFVWDQFDAGQ